MEKYFWISALLACFAIQGCKAPETVTVRLDGSRTVGVRTGQILALELESNATTGYGWEVADTLNEGIISPYGKPRYILKSALLGAGGYHVFRFQPLKKGTAMLKFEYRRPWETGVKPVKAYVIRVVVN